MDTAAAGLGRFPATMEHKGPLGIAEALVDGYLEGAEGASATNPRRLQKLAEQAISGLA
jgi:hypothetical protein